MTIWEQNPPSPARTPRLSPGNKAHHQDMLELAVDSWTSQYNIEDAKYNSVAAVAGLPANAEPAAANDLQAAQPPIIPFNHFLGTVQAVTMQEQNRRVVASPQDRSMARIYQLLDDAGSPRYLGDAIIRQIRSESLFNNFDPCDPAISLRDAFMHRASRSFGSMPPEAIPVTLETGQKVTVYRFPFLQFYQKHLLSAPLLGH
jgi:hypothetical protein